MREETNGVEKTQGGGGNHPHPGSPKVNLGFISAPVSQLTYLLPYLHIRQLPVHSEHLTDSNFIARMLYTNIY